MRALRASLQSSLIALFAVSISTFATAQTRVCITGRVLPAGGPSICGQLFSHSLDCTNVFLRSQTVNLANFVGQIVRIEGVDVGVTCPIIEVASVGQPFATLEICGSPSPGCQVKLNVRPGAIGQWWLFASFFNGYQPLGCVQSGFLDGTVLLQLPAVGVNSGIFMGPVGSTTIPIPNDPNLIGVRVFFQGVRQDIGPVGPLQLTNTECIQIRPGPCTQPNC